MDPTLSIDVLEPEKFLDQCIHAIWEDYNNKNLGEHVPQVFKDEKADIVDAMVKVLKKTPLKDRNIRWKHFDELSNHCAEIYRSYRNSYRTNTNCKVLGNHGLRSKAKAVERDNLGSSRSRSVDPVDENNSEETQGIENIEDDFDREYQKRHHLDGAILNDEEWSLMKNYAFMLGAIHSKQTIYLSLNEDGKVDKGVIDEHVLYDKDNNRPRVFAIELAILFAAGYERFVHPHENTLGFTMVPKDPEKALKFTFTELFHAAKNVNIKEIEEQFYKNLFMSPDSIRKSPAKQAKQTITSKPFTVLA